MKTVCKTYSTFCINCFQHFHYKMHVSTDKRGWCASQSTGYVHSACRVLSCSPIHQSPLATCFKRNNTNLNNHIFTQPYSAYIHKTYWHFDWSFSGSSSCINRLPFYHVWCQIYRISILIRLTFLVIKHEIQSIKCSSNSVKVKTQQLLNYWVKAVIHVLCTPLWLHHC